MSKVSCPAVLISAPASGQGKTLATAALARAWKNRGLKVRAFKCGPDFLDPMILQKASNHPVYNLDLGMCGSDDGLKRLHAAAQEADVIIVEGVMGLYDGNPSSADIAARYGLPVLLAIDAGGMAQTFGALASGLLAYKPELKPAGVLANKVGSAGHAKLLRDSLPPHLSWFGALPRDADFALPERHLGLFRADEIDDLDARIEAAARALTDSGELPLPPAVSFELPAGEGQAPLLAGKTIAVARDAAFCFIYPANLDWLREMGAKVAFFSPLHDQALPDADACWLPGGYPELHLEALAGNTAMRDALRRAWQQGKPMLAECGGMMALTESIDDRPAFGLLPGKCRMHDRLQGLGVMQMTLPTGDLGAHVFHYGSFETGLTPVATMPSRFGKPEHVYRHGSLQASFLHFYFASNPAAAASLFLSNEHRS
ncbi:MAG: cobyrinate a,c-diamide synthase [Betaproteobacteria bacterium HGW-Betaproteobacteria-16]|nr:MAG: cobyrinate a,c-diamide synthase [Betaproteobacteria bacterium HGW-Betaproteobacteria-16]